ncbi:hypothetical protein OROHE_014280 [Orobanche hederae]
MDKYYARTTVKSSEKRPRIESNVASDNIVSDPALRKSINDYEPGIRDDIRRKFVQMGPCRPSSHVFPRSQCGDKMRCFQIDWFEKWEWLEYSISEDAAFCLWCYLFEEKRAGDLPFTKNGFRNWKKATEKFEDHVGNEGSIHNNAKTLYLGFKDQRQSVTRKLSMGTEVIGAAYRMRLTASVDVARLLLGLGLAFRGNDESSMSIRRGNFLELLAWYSLRNIDVGNVVKENAPANHQLTSPDIQKQIISACASETTKAIISDIGDKYFSLLLDEARDNSVKEQMAVVIRYANNRGEVLERFVGVVHVQDTTAVSLKSAIDNFFSKHGLSMSKVRGQGYDGASNMRGELNGLKTLILNENPYARYVHCFAHQLQLVVVAVAEGNQFISDFFDYMSMVTNIVGASCKRKDELRQKQHEIMVEQLETGQVTTGRGLNQETSLTRPGDTRWGSHYKTIIRLLSMWSSVIKVLINIYKDGSERKSKGKVVGLLDKMEKYEFVFIAHLMKVVLGITNGLSQFLQQKDQNIIGAMNLVINVKRQLQDLRDNGWDELLEEVSVFCSEHDIVIPDMEDNVPGRIRSKNSTTYYHHFRIGIFCQVLDRVGQEMESRFSESSTELLMCIACLDPKSSFSNFNLSKVVRLAELYPLEFSPSHRMELKEELKMWISEMRRNDTFSKLQNIGDLAKKMVEVGYQRCFPLVYLLIELILVLPVATATVERAFSAMNIIKSNLRNKMGDEFLTDCLVCYIEKDLFTAIDNEVILQHFQNMKTRRTDLPSLRIE